ncbi:hypothetical protein BH23GEM9_BH23GEM9_08550 [soil metagenome]
MKRRPISGILLVLVAGIAIAPSPAEAIPSFARKYRVSCNLCHSPAPRLTAFGEQFAANGFEFVPAEEPLDTLDTGDDLLRLIRRIDFAFRMDAYADLSRPIGRDGTAMDLQMPYNIKLLSGGPIADKISYYLYFFLSERGQVAGLEDAYIQFTDIAGSGVAVMAGQFQVSDPLFKRELRLQYEDYQPYRVRVGHARPDLTYDRGLFLTYAPWEGGDVAMMVVNGQGLGAAAADRLYDRDNQKNFVLRYSQEAGPLRIGAFGYYGRERAEGQTDRIVVWGPDATISPMDNVEFNLQFLRREDTNPMLEVGGPSTRVNSAFGEVIVGPFGSDGRWYATGLYNWIDADQPLLSLRIGEQATGTGFMKRYHAASGGIHYLLQRNVRLLGEVGWDLERSEPRFTAGATLAW